MSWLILSSSLFLARTLSSLCGLLLLFFLEGGGATMAKSKVDRWLDPDDGLLLLQDWARMGLTDEQIAHNMGISRSTLSEYKVKYPIISDTLKKGKDVIDIQVENALLKSALEGSNTAQIFWLKNRRPDRWRDKRDVDVTSTQIEKLDDILAQIKEGASTDD